MKYSAFKRGVLRRFGLPPKILMIVRIVVVILTTCLMQVSAAGFAQKLTLSKKGATLEQIFSEIRKQTGYFVVYAENKVDKTTKLDVSFNNTDLKDVLDVVSKSQNLEYSFDERNISLKPKEPSFLDNLVARFADIDVRGRVVDETGNPLPNASIQVKGKVKVYNSNDKGEFTIDNVADDAILVVRYVGYKPLEIAVKDVVMPLEIKLNVATGELEEVNVTYSTGYQNIPKERSTGSFSYVDKETINRGVSTNILDRLTGFTSGLNFEPIKPGNPTTLSIRGISTINANINPLIVVDGFPYDESASFQNVINDLNPSDVENITILKDAAAASIWGVRAGNGVIVITTKRGKYNEATKVQARSNVTIGDKPNLFYKPILSPSNYLELERILFAQGVYNENLNNRTTFPVVSQGIEILQKLKLGQITEGLADEQLSALKNQDLRNDFNRHFMQNSFNQQYAINVSGGGTRYNYFSSVGFDKDRNSFVKNQYDRLTLRFDNTYRLMKSLELSGFASYTKNGNRTAGSTSYESLFGGASKVALYTNIIDVEGKSTAIPFVYRTAYIDTAKYPALLDWRFRPLDELNLTRTNTKSFDTRLGGGLKYTLIAGLNADVKYQYQRSYNSGETYSDMQSYSVRDLVNRYMSRSRNDGSIRYNFPNGAIIRNSSNTVTQWNFRGQINFNQNWKKHDLSALAGTEMRELTSDALRQTRYGFDPLNGVFRSQINYDSIYRVRPAGTERIPNEDAYNSTINRYTSYFSNAAYTYNNKYIISISGRVDGSNFFGVKANNRIVPLWSAGLAWNISNESFYKSSWMPYLKLRATYGYNGNTNNSATAYTTIKYQTSVSTLNNSVAADILTAPNPELRWEKVKVINLGLDFSTKNNVIAGSIEYYTKHGIDLIGPIEVDPTTGVGSFSGNRANIKGNGLDLTLNSQNTKGVIKWSSNLLFSYNSEKVTAYTFPASTGQAKLLGGIVLGDALNSVYSYKWAGLDSKNGDPQIFLGDTISNFNNLSKASLNDIPYHGSVRPTFFGSLRNTITWKQLSLSFNVIYKFNYYFRRSSINYTNLLTAAAWNTHADYMGRWQRQGDELMTNVPSLPKVTNTLRDNAYLYSDLMVEKGAHIRLQDIRINYNLNKSGIKSLPFNSAQFFIYANNLGIIWRANKKGIDPDFGDNMNGYLPTPRAFSLGIDLSF